MFVCHFYFLVGRPRCLRTPPSERKRLLYRAGFGVEGNKFEMGLWCEICGKKDVECEIPGVHMRCDVKGSAVRQERETLRAHGKTETEKVTGAREERHGKEKCDICMVVRTVCDNEGVHFSGTTANVGWCNEVLACVCVCMCFRVFEVTVCV